jgi:hypothetical protein
VTIRYQYLSDASPVFFGPEEPHPAAFDPQNYPQQVQISRLQNRLGTQAAYQDYSFFAGGYTGIELTSMDKWYQPLERPGVPKRLPVSAVPFTWLTQFEEPVFPIPSVATWFKMWENPFKGKTTHPSQVPYTAYTYLPPVSGCIEAELVQTYIYRTTPQPVMPILYIRNIDKYNAGIECGSTRQSPGTQPQFGP